MEGRYISSRFHTGGYMTTPHPSRQRCLRSTGGLLLAVATLTLSACGGNGSGEGTPATASQQLTPAAPVSSNGRLTLEQQDDPGAAGAAVSTSSRYTLISEDSTP